MSKPMNVHGTGLLLGTTGVLLRGPSGSGKSILALALLDRWDGRGLAAFLVADDRVELSALGQIVSMQAPERIAGRIELRGRGIVSRAHKSPVQLNLVVDLVADLVRMPDPAEFVTMIAGVPLARAPIPDADTVSVTHQMLLVIAAIDDLPGGTTAP